MNDINELKTESYLTFKLAKENFAINVRSVLSILEVEKITVVPKAPYYMKGIINLRGSVLPIIDIRLKFAMEPIEITSNTSILVLDVIIENASVKVGILVDGVEEVVEISKDQIKEPPSIGSKYQSEFIYGMAKLEEEFLMLVDMDKVFSVDEIIDLKTTLPDKNKMVGSV